MLRWILLGADGKSLERRESGKSRDWSDLEEIDNTKSASDSTSKSKDQC